MNPTPRVSFLLPTYNDASTLRETLDSVLAQTFGDFDVIVVDDAAADETPRLLAAYADPRLRVVRNDRNLGLIASLNRGLTLCRGEFVARIDGDDVCEPQRLARQVALLDDRPDVCGCCTWTREIDETGTFTGKSAQPVPDAAWLRWHMAHTLRMYHPTMTLRRRVLLDAGGYDADAHAVEDYELWTRLSAMGHAFGVVPEPLVRYRRRVGSVTANNAGRQREAGVAIATRHVAAVTGRHIPPEIVADMRALLSFSHPAPFDPRAALEVMKAMRRACFVGRSEGRREADREASERLVRHARRWLADAPEAALRPALRALRLTPRNSVVRRTVWDAARCAASNGLRSWRA